MNFRGTQVSVIPLNAGPEIILAGGGADLVVGSGNVFNATKQVVQVTDRWWRLLRRDELGDARNHVPVTVTSADGPSLR